MDKNREELIDWIICRILVNERLMNRYRDIRVSCDNDSYQFAMDEHEHLKKIAELLKKDDAWNEWSRIPVNRRVLARIQDGNAESVAIIRMDYDFNIFYDSGLHVHGMVTGWKELPE